ncbi:SIR2 family protein, partial [Cupriavidus sp. UYPR2.512]|uniref:SIR2 family protein n=1 Tax=Cupriavidus sp. UYPR2.512 TaxID=1080187 RepID=UPI00055BFD3E
MLLQQFQIVFVGYSADDPPVQYLLEALKRFGPSQRNAMYAFHWGDERQAIAQWSHKAVTPLAFQEFSHLWETLSAWAARARGVDKWHDDLIKMASAGPASMQPHERGMVAHMAATEEGSHRLAIAESPIPAEWLFVFDKCARLRGPAQEHATPFKEGIEFFKKVGLDSDAAPEFSLDTMAPDPVELPGSAWDAFSPTDIDVVTARPESLSRVERRAVPPLPRRLANLGRWFGKVAHEPAALIWAAGETSLHPDLRERLTNAMRFDTARYSELIRKQWQWILASWNSDQYDVDNQFHIVKRQVEIDGWTPALLRAAIQLYRARLNVKPAFDERWHRLFGQGSGVFKWKRWGSQAADLIAGSV